MGMDKVPWVGTVDPRAAVGQVWVQLSSPMQDSGYYVTMDIWRGGFEDYHGGPYIIIPFIIFVFQYKYVGFFVC